MSKPTQLTPAHPASPSRPLNSLNLLPCGHGKRTGLAFLPPRLHTGPSLTLPTRGAAIDPEHTCAAMSIVKLLPCQLVKSYRPQPPVPRDPALWPESTLNGQGPSELLNISHITPAPTHSRQEGCLGILDHWARHQSLITLVFLWKPSLEKWLPFLPLVFHGYIT